jgi:hypothetical protein
MFGQKQLCTELVWLPIGLCSFPHAPSSWSPPHSHSLAVLAVFVVEQKVQMHLLRQLTYETISRALGP